MDEIQAQEQAAIAACGHQRVEVLDRDALWTRDGEHRIGTTELLFCPDCPLGGEKGEWFEVSYSVPKGE